MIGLGVGIDYALFIVTRYREGLHNGLSSEEATSIAINTAGRAVLFAGTTVVISLLGMLVMGLAFVTGLAIGAALTVLATMVASVTLLPALLGFARHRVEVTRWRGIIAARLVSIGLIGVGLGFAPLMVALPLAAHRASSPASSSPPLRKRGAEAAPPSRCERTLAYRWSRLIQHQPVAGGHPRRSSCWSGWPCRSSRCASASPTPATAAPTRPPGRPTTCWPRASAPASTVRCSS